MTDITMLFESHKDVAFRCANRKWARRDRRHLRAEIEQAALIGLWKASQRWDSNRAVPFRAYAIRRIMGEIIDWLRVELGHPTRNRQLYREWRGVPIDSRDSKGDRLRECIQGSESTCAIEVKEEVVNALRDLEQRERHCFILYHGWGCTMKEIGDRIGLGNSMVGLILKAAEKKLGIDRRGKGPNIAMALLTKKRPKLQEQA